MAYGGNEDDDYQLGMFSMIIGVEVKIGEKFKAPEKLSLPIGWEPSDPTELLRFEYDFWKENEVIRRAEEERLTQEKMTNNLDNEEETVTDIVNDEDEEEEPSPNTSAESNVNEILTPFVLPSEGVENKLDETHKKINVEEFEEDQNQNPFERVELQTLDEIDELRSVLEPTSKGKKVIKSKDLINNYENFELDANFFNNIDVAKPVPTVASENFILNYSENQTNVVSEPVNTTAKDDFNIPEHMAHGTLNWTKFNKDTLLKYRSANQSADNMYVQGMDQLPNCPIVNGQVTMVTGNQNNGQNPAMMPYEVSTGYNPGLMSKSVTNIPNVDTVTVVTNENKPLSYGQILFMSDDLPRTKSMPELEGNSDQCFNPNNEAPPVAYNESNQLKFNIDKSQVDNVVRTDRIDSIMKQYQFQRLSNMPNMPAATNYNPTSSTPISNMATNPAQYVGMPGAPPPQTISTNVNMPTESFTASLPFSIQDANTGIRSNVGYNTQNTNMPANSMASCPLQSPVNSIPSSINQNQPPISSFNFQRFPQNIPTGQNISVGQNIAAGPNMPAAYKPDVNPFSKSNIPNQNNSQVPTSMYRHGVLPPLPVERSHATSSFNPAMSQPHAYSQAYHTTTTPQLSETDLRASQSPLLPNIPSQETPGYHPNTNGMSSKAPTPSPQETLSWLVDPTEDLPLNQKNFAYQISAMGFSLPCVSRTVLRLGIDEKEVLDFLCSVQDLKEKDFHSDDIEMALLNLQDEKEKVSSYLEMVNTLRELGFKPSEIHDALLQTSVDQNKAIDYLTSSR